ncbi:MAG: hypothetical protein JO170_32845 [Verrucomicrobia bacterium]|nr:hypothetical protein [Verrucomicrobiota bacterium]
MNLASDALSKFDGSTAPPLSPAPAQQPETHPTPPNPSPAPQPTPDSLSPVVPSQPAAVAVPAPVPVAESQTPPGGGSIEQQQEEEARLEEPPAQAATNLNSAKAEAKLVKALDYLVAINDHSDNPGQKWFINESILASLTGCFRPAIKKFAETHRSFINQANNPRTRTRPQPWQSKGRSRRYPSPG